MNKQDVDEILKETNGEIIYCEQLIQVLTCLGYTYDEANIIRKAYAKRLIDKVQKFEQDLRSKSDLAEYVISKIRGNVHSMYWKIQEDACRFRSNAQ